MRENIFLTFSRYFYCFQYLFKKKLKFKNVLSIRPTINIFISKNLINFLINLILMLSY